MKRPPGLWLLLSAGVVWLSLQNVYSLKATELIFGRTTTTSTTPDPNASPSPEGANKDSGVTEAPADANTTIKSNLTGIPQIDYIYDPNLPRELNGYNLSDYPFYNGIPEDIDFKCDGLHDGFYASIPHKCQVYHHCLYGTRFDFLCANYTAFDQKTFICHFVSEVDCKNSPKFWHRNDALYQAATTSSTTRKPTTAPPPPPNPTEPSGRRPPTRVRRPPQRRPHYDYYDDEYYYDDEEEYYDPPPRTKGRRWKRPRPRRPAYDDDRYEDDRPRRRGSSRRKESYDRREDDRRDYRDRDRDKEDAYEDESKYDGRRSNGKPRDEEEKEAPRHHVNMRKHEERDEEEASRKKNRRPYDEESYEEDQPRKVASEPPTGPMVKPSSSSSVYSQPRQAPKIRRPVPKNEQSKYNYKTTTKPPPPKAQEDEEEYYDDYEEVEPAPKATKPEPEAGESRRPHKPVREEREPEISESRRPNTREYSKAPERTNKPPSYENDTERPRKHQTSHERETSKQSSYEREPDRASIYNREVERSQEDEDEEERPRKQSSYGRDAERPNKQSTYEDESQQPSSHERRAERPNKQRDDNKTPEPELSESRRSSNREADESRFRGQTKYDSPPNRSESRKHIKRPLYEEDEEFEDEVEEKPRHRRPRPSKEDRKPDENSKPKERTTRKPAPIEEVIEDIAPPPRKPAAVEATQKALTRNRYLSTPKFVPKGPRMRPEQRTSTTTSTTTTTTTAPTTSTTTTIRTTRMRDRPDHIVRIVKRPFLPSRGGNPYLPRGLQPVGAKAADITTQNRSTKAPEEEEKREATNMKTFDTPEPEEADEFYDDVEEEEEDEQTPISVTLDNTQAYKVKETSQDEQAMFKPAPVVVKVPVQPKYTIPTTSSGTTGPAIDVQNRPLPILRPLKAKTYVQEQQKAAEKPPSELKNPLDINENEYDVTLNDALNPTLPNLPVRNFPTGFSASNDYSYSNYHRPRYDLTDARFQVRAPSQKVEAYAQPYTSLDLRHLMRSEYSDQYSAPSEPRYQTHKFRPNHHVTQTRTQPFYAIFQT